MLKQLKFYLICLLIAVPTALAVYFYLFGSPRSGIELIGDAPALVRQIQELRELVTVKYSVQKVVTLKEEKVPFGSESLLLLVHAEVLGGVDLAKLTPADVSLASDRSVSIKLPAPEILHRYVNDKDTKVWDRQKTWWTPWEPFNPELDQKARQLALESARAAALEMGILRDAQTNAERVLTNFLTAVGIPAVRFEAGNEREP